MIFVNISFGLFFFFQAEDGIRDRLVTGVQTCALPIYGFAPIMTCEVNMRPPNKVSIFFHEKYGFEKVGTQKTEGGNKEVSLMVYKIPFNR